MAALERTDRSTVRRKATRASYDRDTVNSILDEAFLCHVGVVVDSTPRVIPTSYGRDGDSLYLHGARNNAALRALLAAEGCLTVTLLDGLVLARSVLHHSMNFRSVVLYAQAEEVVDADEKRAAMHTIVEHIIPGRWDDARQPTDAEVEATLIVRVPINECSAKIRSGPPEDAEQDMALQHWAGVLPTKHAWLTPEADPQLDAGIEAPDYVTGYSRTTA